MVASLAAKKIVLCSDGTGNSSAKSEKTNVWRLFQALDLSGPDQVAAYDDGVGTSRFKYWAIIEGAFGIGLKRNVLDLYKFACRNYPNPNGGRRSQTFLDQTFTGSGSAGAPLPFGSWSTSSLKRGWSVIALKKNWSATPAPHIGIIVERLFRPHGVFHSR
jgi:hypothetical protein